MAREGGTYYLFSTGDPAGSIGNGNIQIRTSANLRTWTYAGTVFADKPAWITSALGSIPNLWAPDISYFGGVYHLYYAASTFGNNKSCIGQATRAALDSGSWADQGMVLCSNIGETDNWNAIDPNVVVDDAGTPWLAFGSFWSGLKMVKLTSTGARADTMLYSIANGASSRGSLEGGWIFKRCGYYYLFMSLDFCCQGANSNYRVVVGRANQVTGPYFDRTGLNMLDGGGTPVVSGDSRWAGPGHNAGVPHPRAVPADLPEAQLGAAGVADLAHHQDVERDTERRSDRRRDLDTAAGQAEHDSVCRGAEALAEQLYLTMEGERETPPIVRAAFQRQPLAEAAWKALTPIQRRNYLFGIFYSQRPESREKRVRQVMDEAIARYRRRTDGETAQGVPNILREP